MCCDTGDKDENVILLLVVVNDIGGRTDRKMETMKMAAIIREELVVRNGLRRLVIRDSQRRIMLCIVFEQWPSTSDRRRRKVWSPGRQIPLRWVTLFPTAPARTP